MQTSHIKPGNMVVQIILMIVTLGIYAIYWFHVTLKELHRANGNDEAAGMWTFLSIIPLVQLFAFWLIPSNTPGSWTTSTRPSPSSFCGSCSTRWSGSWSGTT